MNVIALIIAIAVIFALYGILFKNKQQDNPNSTPQFNEETAEELAVPLQQPVSEPAPAPEMELPHNYGVDRLLLLVRDPHWLYAYWEVSATKQQEFNTNFGAEAWNTTTPVLRVYEVNGEYFNGDNMTGYIDIELDESCDNWHINVGKSNSSFCADLGRVFPGGRFVTVLRSNLVTTPREDLSDSLDEEWMWIEDIYKSLTSIPYGVSSPGMSRKIDKSALPLGISSPGVSSPGVSSPGPGQSWQSDED